MDVVVTVGGNEDYEVGLVTLQQTWWLWVGYSERS